MISITKEPSDTYIKSLKEEILVEITKKLKEKILETVNQNVQGALKKFQNNKNKEHEKTRTETNK
jgi:hypothetical protein